MSVCEQTIVSVNGVSTRLLHCGITLDADHYEWRATNATIVLFITGNPGEIGYYSDTMQIIHERTGLPVLGVSHAGHNRIPQNNTLLGFSDNKDDKDNDFYSLRGQIFHKKYFIDRFISSTSSIILIGHSIGCYMILQILDQFADIRSKVLHSILIFPTIEYLGETSDGKKYQFLFGWFKYPLLALSYVIDRLSERYKQKMVSFAIGSASDLPDCALQSAVNLTNPYCLSATINLALMEFKTVKEVNRGAIRANSDRLTLLYGERDQWCPTEYFERTKRSFPDSDVRLCLSDIGHDFVLNKESTERVSQMVANIIQVVKQKNRIV